MVYSILFATALFCHAASAVNVLTHFMVANTYSYSQTEWRADIVAAQQIGIDGFALNFAPPDCSIPYNTDWVVSRIDDAFAVASTMDFKLVYSFDMGYIPQYCTFGWNQTFMASMITKYAKGPAFYRWNGEILVTTYAGEGYGDSFFAGLKSMLAGQGVPIVLAPALTTYSDNAQQKTGAPLNSIVDGMVSSYPSIDGFLNWQAWPLDQKYNLTADVDVAFDSALKNASRSGPYIMAVSPWQFKDLNDGYYNSWVQYSDTLFDYRWREAINTVQPDIVEILTWNDFPESHYIRDLPPMSGPGSTYLGDSGNYIYGIDHSAWRIMAQYYISWYKTGHPPKVDEDRVVFWYRTHPKLVPCANGNNQAAGTPPVRNANNPADAVFAWAVVKQHATISMTVGSNVNWQFEADPGSPVLNMVPFPADIGSGVIPMVAITRHGQTVAAGNGSVAITTQCAYQNYNPVVALAGPGLSASDSVSKNKCQD